MQNMLDRIIVHKKQEVENAQKNLPLSEIEVQARMAAAPRGFIKAIQTTLHNKAPALIAEVKKASPSKGLIREDFDPATLAYSYEAGGATCISVLTDVPFFQGHPIYLKEVRTASTLPVLRKDFMIDPYQVVEARAWGADCILVIMAAVDDAMAHSLTNLALKWGMDVLVEVHNRQELERALKLNTQLIGINNRNLQTFDIKLEVTEGLAPLIPGDRIIVSESGISKPEDITRLSKIGVSTYLVGESLMRQEHVENATRHLLGKELVTSDNNASGLPDKRAHDEPSALLPGDDVAAGQQVQDAAQKNPPLNDDFQAAVEELGALIGTETGAKTSEDVASAGVAHDDASAEPDESSSAVLEQVAATMAHAAKSLSHVNEAGEAHMVDVSQKSSSERVAVAVGFVHMAPETLAQIQQNTLKKGDVLAAARIAGIMAAKETSRLIPLCHPLGITSVDVSFQPSSQPNPGIKITAMVKVVGQTGVEMEALTAVSVAGLTIYDMAKAVDKEMRIDGIHLREKQGGRSGVYKAANNKAANSGD